MNEKEMVNVVIPVYNAEKYLDLCIGSLLSQTYTNWHAIMVDDGSKDNSAKVCEEYCKKYPDKLEFYQRNHGGPGATRNYAISKSSEEAGYWFFLDSDDYIDDNTFEVLINTIKKDNTQMAVCGYVRHGGKRFKEISSSKCGILSPKEVIVSLLENDEIGSFSCNKMFTYDILNEVRYPEGCFYEDVALFYKVALKCRAISVIKKPMYHYVWHKTSVVVSKNIQQLNDFRTAINDRAEYIIKLFPELEDMLILDRLRVSIYIWNRTCKVFSEKAVNRCARELEIIRKYSDFYVKLGLKNRIMAKVISRYPRIYAKGLYIMRDFFLLK